MYTCCLKPGDDQFLHLLLEELLETLRDARLFVVLIRKRLWLFSSDIQVPVLFTFFYWSTKTLCSALLVPVGELAVREFVGRAGRRAK